MKVVCLIEERGIASWLYNNGDKFSFNVSYFLQFLSFAVFLPAIYMSCTESAVHGLVEV